MGVLSETGFDFRKSVQIKRNLSVLDGTAAGQ